MAKYIGLPEQSHSISENRRIICDMCGNVLTLAEISNICIPFSDLWKIFLISVHTRGPEAIFRAFIHGLTASIHVRDGIAIRQRSGMLVSIMSYNDSGKCQPFTNMRTRGWLRSFESKHFESNITADESKAKNNNIKKNLNKIGGNNSKHTFLCACIHDSSLARSARTGIACD